MKKKIFFFMVLVFLLFLPLIQAQNGTLVIEKQVIHDVVTMEEISIPATYNFTIKNPNNYDDFFKMYTLFDAQFSPLSRISVPANLETSVIVTFLPKKTLKEDCGEGTCKVKYYLKAERSGVIEDYIPIRIFPLSKIIETNIPSSITREDKVLIFNVTNKENIDFGGIQFTLDSEFSKIEKNITLGPESSEKIELQLDTEKLKVAEAGEYEVKLKFFINNEYEYVINKTIILEEFTSIKTEEKNKFSFFGFTKIITKKNEGNSPKLIMIEITKNKFEHAFTYSNIEPTSIETTDALVKMSWQRELEPGESFSVEVHTDYTIPVVILILIIIVVLAIWLAKRPRVIVKKKAFKIKTKGGEFALKLVLLIKNIGKPISNVKCTDKLPHMTKIYERFGASKPDKIEKNRLVWNFGDLMPGEERIVSYIIYSKVTPVGTIRIPKAVVSYINEKEMKRIAYSNELFAMGEPEK